MARSCRRYRQGPPVTQWTEVELQDIAVLDTWVEQQAARLFPDAPGTGTPLPEEVAPEPVSGLEEVWAMASEEERHHAFLTARLVGSFGADRPGTAAGVWVGFCDGACEPNPGLMGIGGYLVTAAGEQIAFARALGHGTNNEAEYRAVIALLELALEHGVTRLRVMTDSKLVVEQMSGRWAVKSPSLATLRQEALRWCARFEEVSFAWVARLENTAADRLAKQGCAQNRPYRDAGCLK